MISRLRDPSKRKHHRAGQRRAFGRAARVNLATMTIKKLARLVRKWGAPRVVVKNPEKHLSAHARRRLKEQS